MRILSTRVSGYGPLEGVELDLDADLNVIYGPNEAGKTTLLDFLLSHLFRWEQRSGTRPATVLEGLGRFGDPSGGGSVELRLDGRVYAYPGEGPSLLHHLELEYAGLTGLFCVRSGELELPEKEAGEFWAELKKVLSGLPEGVDTLRERAHGEAGLTPTGRQLSDAGTPGRRTRRAELEERAGALSRLGGRLEEVSEVAEEVARLEERRERLELARRARVAELHGRLEETRARLEELPALPAGLLERWERLAEERARVEEALRRGRESLARAREAADERDDRRREAEERARSLASRLEEVRDAGLEDRARGLEGKAPSGLPARLAGPAYLAGWAVLGVAILTVFFLPSDLLRRPAWLVGLLSALAAGGGLFLWGRSVRRRRDDVEEERASLLEEAAAGGLEVSSVPDVPGAVRRLEEAVHEARRELEGARARAESAGERAEERAGTLEERESRLEEIRDEIASLRGEADAGPVEERGLEGARALADERAGLEDRAEQLRAELQGLAGRDEAAWDVEPPDDPDLPAWSASEKKRIDDRLEGLRRRHRELQRAFDRAGLDAPEDALTELQRCRAEIEGIDLDREAGRLAGEIFATMGEALEERLAAALAREGDFSVGALTRRFTERYVEVVRGEASGVVVRDREGRAFPAARLSRGARDQVYVALRLGLADAALEAAGAEEPGFFLLDDAFLTADWERRRRLVEAVAGLAGEGWQIVYLTCDDHLRDLFVEAGARLHEL